MPLKLPADSGRHRVIPSTWAFKYFLPCRLLDVVVVGRGFFK